MFRKGRNCADLRTALTVIRASNRPANPQKSQHESAPFIRNRQLLRRSAIALW
jgi:hypothetical protein